MNYAFISLLILLSSCSSGELKEKSISPDEVSKDSFKKEKPISNAEFKDFYPAQTKTMNPALQDETLDRYSAEELEKISETADPLIEISIRCSKGDFTKAFQVASSAFDRYQKIPAYWNLIANCHLNQGSGRKALLFYNKALEVSPGYVPALNNIGVYYSRQGDDQKALLAFEKANKQSRFSKTPRYNLARTYLKYGLASSALPLFKGLLSESQADVELLNAVGSCYFLMSNYQQAYEFFSRIPSSLLERSEYGLNMAVTLKKMGRVQEAFTLFNKIEKPKKSELKEYYSAIGNHLGVK